MKKWIMVSGVIFLFLIAAAMGRFFNSQIILDSNQSDALAKARLSLLDFKKHFDPNLKTVVVFGTSSSLFSYPDNQKAYYPQNRSYVDLLPKNVNVLNLSNHHFFSFEQFASVLDLTVSELPKIDYVILENLRFMAPTPKLVDEWDYIGLALRSCYSSQTNPRIHTLCSDVFTHIFDSFKLRTSASACARKYEKLLSLSYFQKIDDRQKMITSALRCDWFFSPLGESNQLIMEKFRFGQLMDLASALKNFNLSLEEIPAQFYREAYYSLDQIILNFYLNQLADGHRQLKFVVIPSAAKLLNGIGELEAFQRNQNLFFLEINSYLDSIISVNHQKFIDLFPDGSHAKFWIHQYLANQISLKYLQ